MLRIYPLALGSAATGTSGYSMAGVLPELSRHLGIHPSAAGQLVTVFALACAVAGPLVVGATRGWHRRRVVVTALVIAGLGNAFTALAPSLSLLVGARIATAVGVAVYVPAASALAAAVAAGNQRARATAVVIAGLTVAMLLGVPVTTALLAALGGYRGVFLVITALCVLAAAAITMVVPTTSTIPTSDTRPQQHATHNQEPVSDRRLFALLGVTLLGTLGTFSVYTYVTVFLDSSAVRGWPVSALLACYGIGAVLGNLIAGRCADRWHPAWVLLVASVTSCVALLLLTAASAAPYTLAVVLMVWGGACWAVYSPVNALLHAPVLLSINGSCVYVGMAAGAMVGGLVIASAGIGSLPHAAALAAAGAAALALAARRRRAEPRPRPAAITTSVT